MRKKIICLELVCLLAVTQPLASAALAKPITQEAATEAAKAEKNNPAWLAALNLILPLGEKVLGWLFGPKEEKKLKRNEVEAIITGVLAQVKQQMEGVTGDVERIRTWRSLANEIDGRGSLKNGGSIKDALLETKATVRWVDTLSDPGAFMAWADLNSRLPATAIHVVTVIENLNLDAIHGPYRAEIEKALDKLARRTQLMSDTISALQGGEDVHRLRDGIKSLSPHLEVAIEACNEISIQHDGFQRDLGVDFVRFMEKFGAQPPEELKRAAALPAPLFLQAESADMELAAASLRYQQAEADWRVLEARAAASAGAKVHKDVALFTGAEVRPEVVAEARQATEGAASDLVFWQQSRLAVARRWAELQSAPDQKVLREKLQAAIEKLGVVQQ